jgi:allophanate hydrolase
VDDLAAVYDRIESESPACVWISLAARNDVLDRARQVEQVADLPLRGQAFAVKDNIDIAGLQTTAACPAFAYTPIASAPVVTRLEAAGAIVVGKTNLDQFATGLVGTRSPYGACSSVFDADRISGGSSSGSAVAVAAGLVDFALATDTAGSGRVPAAFNGIVGLKPTRGLLSTRGVVPACRSLDCVSILTRSATTARDVFDVIRGYDAEDPYARRAVDPANTSTWLGRDVRFGVPHGDLGGRGINDPPFRRAVERLTQLGGTRVEVDFGPFRQAGDLLYGPWVAERFADLGDFIQNHPDDVISVVRDIILESHRYSAADLFAAQHRLQAVRREVEATFQSIDVLVVPTVLRHPTHAEIAADPVGGNAALGYYTTFVNLLDLAAIAVPGGLRTGGLPFGISLIAPALSDDALLDLAERVQ